MSAPNNRPLKLLEYLREYASNNAGRLPTRHEICAVTGYGLSTNELHIQMLKNCGYLTSTPRPPGTLRITPLGWQADTSRPHLMAQTTEAERIERIVQQAAERGASTWERDNASRSKRVSGSRVA